MRKGGIRNGCIAHFLHTSRDNFSDSLGVTSARISKRDHLNEDRLDICQLRLLRFTKVVPIGPCCRADAKEKQKEDSCGKGSAPRHMDFLLSNRVLMKVHATKNRHFIIRSKASRLYEGTPSIDLNRQPTVPRPATLSSASFFHSDRQANTQAPPAYGLTGRLVRRYKMSLFIVPFHAQAHSLCSIGEQPSTQRRARVAELADARDLGSRG